MMIFCVPTRFEQQLEFLLDNPSFGFVGGQAEAFYPDGTTVALNYPISSTKEELRQSFLMGYHFLILALCFVNQR